MPMHRKNSARGDPRNSAGEQRWFAANNKRQRRRNALAKESRRRNRGR